MACRSVLGLLLWQAEQEDGRLFLVLLSPYRNCLCILPFHTSVPTHTNTHTHIQTLNTEWWLHPSTGLSWCTHLAHSRPKSRGSWVFVLVVKMAALLLALRSECVSLSFSPAEALHSGSHVWLTVCKAAHLRPAAPGNQTQTDNKSRRRIRIAWRHHWG